MEYLDFTLTISRGQPDSPTAPLATEVGGTPDGPDQAKASDAKYAVRIDSPAGGDTLAMELPFTSQELELRLKDVENAILRAGRTSRLLVSGPSLVVQQFGQDLFKAILPEDGRGFYYQSWERARADDKGLRLKLQIEVPELASLPWEFLNDPRDDSYLGHSTRTPIIREVRVARPFDPLAITGPLRVLGMVASPRGLEPLDTEGERRRVETALAELIDAGRVELKWLQKQTWNALDEEVRDGTFHIFHFIGHGGFDPNADQGVIALANEQGELDLFPAADLALMLKDEWRLRLAVLNACEGAKGSANDVFSSAASILVRSGGVPAVLAMQYEISDTAATAFAQYFYGALADGMPVDAALASARRGMRLADRRSLEWATPVLYQQAPHGVLFTLPPSTDPPVEPEPGLLFRLFQAILSAIITTAGAVRRRLRQLHRVLIPYRTTRLGTSAVLGFGVLLAACLTILAGLAEPGYWYWIVAILLGVALISTAMAGTYPLTQSPFRPYRFLRPAMALTGLLLVVGVVYVVDRSDDPPTVISEVTMFRGDPARTGTQPGPGPVEDDPHVQLLFQANSRVTGSPAVVGGTLYFGSYDFRVYAINASTGAPEWEEPFETSGEVVSSPTVVDGKVYVGSRDGNFYAIDQATGKERWRYTLESEGQINSSPAVIDGVVYFGGMDGKLYALDAGTGEPKWPRPFTTRGGVVFSSPTVIDDVAYVGSGNWDTLGFLQAVDVTTGRERWARELAGMVISSPAVVEGVVFIGTYGYGSNDGRLYAIDADTGEPRWPRSFSSHRTGPHGRANIYSSPAVSDGRVHFGCFDGHVYAVDAATGRQIWAFPQPPDPSLQEVWSSPAVTGGVVYIGTGKPADPDNPDDDGTLHALDAGTGQLIWRLPFDSPITSSPVVVDGVLFIGDHDGNVYAVWDNG